MDKIKLTKDEKKVFLKAMMRQELPPIGMSHDLYFACIVSLHQKGLLEAKFNYDTILGVTPTRYGLAYFAINPTLTNPINWQMITGIATVATATAAIVALFVSCSLL